MLERLWNASFTNIQEGQDGERGRDRTETELKEGGGVEDFGCIVIIQQNVSCSTQGW